MAKRNFTKSSVERFTDRILLILTDPAAEEMPRSEVDACLRALVRERSPLRP
jgi:hypothetical protein